MTDNIDIKIATLLAHHRAPPFAWGRFDCAHFAADALHVLHGHKVPLPDYTTELGARRALRKRGASLAAAVAAAGLVPKALAAAQRGDIVAVQVPGPWGRALGVLVGNAVACPAAVGLHMAPRSQWLQAWEVPSCHK